MLDALEGEPPSAAPLVKAQRKDEDVAWQEATFLEVAALNAGQLRSRVAEPAAADDGGAPSVAVLGLMGGGALLAAVAFVLDRFLAWTVTTVPLLSLAVALLAIGALIWARDLYRSRQEWRGHPNVVSAEERFDEASEAVEKRADELMREDNTAKADAWNRAWQERIFEELAAHSEFASPKERYRALERAAARRTILTADIDKAANEKHGSSHDVWTKVPFGQGDKSGKGEGLAMGGVSMRFHARSRCA